MTPRPDDRSYARVSLLLWLAGVALLAVLVAWLV